MHKISTWVVRVNGKHPKLVEQQRQQQQQQQESKACFKRRATTVLSWLDCSSTQWHDTSTTWFQSSNLIKSNRTAVAENKTQK